MALSPDTSSKTFLREVDEEVRRERIADFWARYNGAVVVSIVALLAAIAGVLWWRSHREGVRGVQGEQLQAAYDKLGAGDAKGAAAGLAPLAADGAPGYRALARMTEADIAAQQHDAAAAGRSLAAVAGDEGAAKPFRDLATVRETTLNYDALKPEVVVQRLRSLAVPGQPFFGSAGEMVGLAYVRMNRRDLAGTLFAQIAADDAVPPTIRQRAIQMASVLSTAAATRPAAQDNKEKPAT